MALINWNEGFSVNVLIIDQQHKKLVDLINGFHDAMIQKKNKEAMINLFTGLIQYTSVHFTTEERYFKQLGYPGTDFHIKQHKALVERVTDMKQRFEKGRLLLSIEVMNFLRDWLTQHILSEDKKYTAFFNSKGLK